MTKPQEMSIHCGEKICGWYRIGANHEMVPMTIRRILATIVCGLHRPQIIVSLNGCDCGCGIETKFQVTMRPELYIWTKTEEEGKVNK